MQRFRWLGVFMLAVSLLVLPGAVVGGDDATALQPRSAVQAGAVARAPDNYTPKPGVKVNNPLTDRRRVILNHIIRSIRSTPKGQHIRIASWNIRSNEFVRALVNAHERGVGVRVLIDEENASPEKPNPGFNNLKYQLSKGNKKRPTILRSWARKCQGSCRGSRGIAHSKIYLFSKVGKARDVVMYSSANATDLAAGYQWNDIYTLVNRPKVYGDFLKIFDEMKLDRRSPPTFRTWTRGSFRSQFHPYGGKQAVGDPVMNELNKIRCKGADGGTGINGRTVIRIAQTATLADRGKRLATKVKSMWDNGCNIRIVYAVMGNGVLQVYRGQQGRGPVPIRQIAQDWNADGVYDRYLHMKVMTVSGVYGKDSSARVAWNGSSNWTGLSMLSDEAGGRIIKARVQQKYADWIDYLFFNPPPQRTGRSTASADVPKVKHGGIEY